MFDRNISQNQAIQRLLATCWMQLEAALLMTLKAAALLLTLSTTGIGEKPPENDSKPSRP